MTRVEKRLWNLLLVQVVVTIIVVVFLYGYVIRLPLVEGLIILVATGVLASAFVGAIAGYILGTTFGMRMGKVEL